MTEGLGYLLYKGEGDRHEDTLYWAIQAALTCLDESPSPVPRCVGVALRAAEKAWTDDVRARRDRQNDIDRVADDQQ